MKNKLRSYQREAVNKMKWALDLPGNDIITMPQGSGKTHVIAGFVEETNLPILILAPNKELLEQDLEKLKGVVDEDEIGVFSASMDEKTVKKYTLGTIQSVYKHPEKFQRFNVVIVDECHLTVIDNKSSMYMSLFKNIGNPKVFGMTATPYRQDTYYEYPGGWENYQGQPWQKRLIESVTTTKMINRYKEGFWRRMLHVVNTTDLLKEGYLSPIEYVDKSMVKHEQLKLNKSKSDFDISAFDNLTKANYPIIAQFLQDLPHNSCIVYCSSVKQARALNALTPNSGVVTSRTNKKDREKTVLALKNGSLHILFNVSIFTLGFDYPSLQSIVFLRPTRSLNLYTQMIGRVSRIAPKKEKGTVYDLVGNVKSMGRLEDIYVVKLNSGWNVISPVKPTGWHNSPLYRFRIHRQKRRKEDSI